MVLLRTQALKGISLTLKDLLLQERIVAATCAQETAYSKVKLGQTQEYNSSRLAISGDLAKNIDRRATLRTNKLHIKEYMATENHKVHIIADCCAPLFSGYGHSSRAARMAQLLAQLIFMAKAQSVAVTLTVIASDPADNMTFQLAHNIRQSYRAIKDIAHLIETAVDIDAYPWQAWQQQAAAGTNAALTSESPHPNPHPQHWGHQLSLALAQRSHGYTMLLSCFDWWHLLLTASQLAALQAAARKAARLSVVRICSSLELGKMQHIIPLTQSGNNYLHPLSEKHMLSLAKEEQALQKLVQSLGHHSCQTVVADDDTLAWNPAPWSGAAPNQ